MRITAATICGVLCVAGLVFGVVFTYASRTFFNATRFSQRAADSLAEPGVARVVSEEITDQIIAARRDLTAYRPVIIGTVEYMVSSAPFRAPSAARPKGPRHPDLVHRREHRARRLRLGLWL
jgi:hypothetical protein